MTPSHPTENDDLNGARPSHAAGQLAAVRAYAERHFAAARLSHSWDHTLRVLRLCRRIGTVEGVNLPVVQMAACLHDIGRCFEDASNGKVCHAEKGAQMARPILDQINLTDSCRDNILHSIRAHRFRGRETPRTPEAKVLFDADKLDAIGAVGVARAYLFAGEIGARLHVSGVAVEQAAPYSEYDTGFREFKVKLSKIKDRMLTSEGRKMASRRHAFMEIFFKRFQEEYEGKR